MGERPFGIDLAATEQIQAVLREHPQVVTRSSSEFSCYPGAYLIVNHIQGGRVCKIIEVRAGCGTAAVSIPGAPAKRYGCRQFLRPGRRHGRCKSYRGGRRDCCFSLSVLCVFRGGFRSSDA